MAHKTFTIKNPKNKDAADITVSTDTGAADFAAFAKLGYEVAEVQKEIAAELAAEEAEAEDAASKASKKAAKPAR